jgi:AcrR family transcriptional regulator
MKRTERTAPAGLSRDRVLDAALALIDRDGIDKLSMRRLGAELGVEAMTLYYYVPNKAALLDGLVERIATRATADMPADGTWRDMLRGFAESCRTELLRHPGVLPLAATRPVLTGAALDVVEAGAARLCRAGFTPHEALHVINIVGTFVLGHTLAEAGTTPGQEDPDTGVLADLDADRYPTFRAALDDGLGDDHQERFDYALDAILTGLRPRRR